MELMHTDLISFEGLTRPSRKTGRTPFIKTSPERQIQYNSKQLPYSINLAAYLIPLTISLPVFSGTEGSHACTVTLCRDLQATSAALRTDSYEVADDKIKKERGGKKKEREARDKYI